MLYPTQTPTRLVMDLSGLWKFKIEGEEAINPSDPLEDALEIAVPASFNDQVVDTSIREHDGYFWYQTSFSIPDFLEDQRLVLRFGSATHEAWVYLNGEELVHHKGGFTPFEAELPKNLEETNILSVRLSNILDYTTLPVGNYSESRDEEGRLVRQVDENFDFFNYAGLHRPVKIYSTPATAHVEDIVVVPEKQGAKDTWTVQTSVCVEGTYDEISLTIIDEEGVEVAQGQGPQADLIVENVRLWQPLDAYLYTLRAEVLKDGQVIDVYDEPFGIRSVEVKDGKFLINDEPFYFKGFGKHEDTYVNGRGLSEPYNVLDISLMKDMGANSLRTSHYPYSEEMMRLCDREGIVVIDEVPAVGLITNFNFDVSNLEKFKESTTWSDMKTKEAHEQALRELVARDKNHACVVMWSIANEAANFADGAYEYFKPLYDLTRELDPQNRPCTTISIMMTLPQTDQTTELADVICLNRYYGWYIYNGDLETAEEKTREELQTWQEMYPDKPIMYTEYGTDTVAGFHSAYGEPFTEEYQTAYYKMNSKVFDEIENFVGEQLWNFADFQTKFGINRVQGNKKGVFTRAREPKQAASYLKDRWTNIPNFNYK